MSDTEDEGTFDKEAEKEKLREQLRREEENRQTTQHMSELLLKGATMTNTHCDTCGDPIFRYDGQEFCPTCTREGRDGDASVPEADEGEDASGTPSAEAGNDAAAEGESGIDRVPTEQVSEPIGGRQASDVRQASSRSDSTTRSGSPGSSEDVAGDVRAARRALVQKLVALANQAEATEDVGRSRELLAAAREAAEALAAVESIDR